ncbi:MAG: ribonuclease P protein component, partial [Methylobacteriaceae bacterium]|nr:ribonuclease P protein component [Methylobacteriaceae bacterium]
GRSLTLARLTARSEFLAAAKGRRVHGPLFSLQGRLRGDEAGLRAGFTLTKRVGSATERNRIKRRLRAALLDGAGPFAAASLDLVVIGRRDALEAPYPELVADLSRALGTLARGPSRRARPDRDVPGGAERPSSSEPDTHA